MDNKVSEIFEGLNEEQRSAVSQIDGPVLIVAGAGSGKTRVLTCRVANILSQGYRPSGILALTFTKKAASEMKERISLMVGENKARQVVMGTFHAVFVRFLREYCEILGYPRDFTIYDTSDSQSAVKTCIRELKLDDKVYRPKAVLSRISSAKNNLVSVSAYRANIKAQMTDSHAKMPRIVDIYAAYQDKLLKSGVMDFDDILVNMHRLLSSDASARKALSERFSHIMVDEYQDTNKVQYEILKLLVGASRNICVVGDDSQSIYAFRGARVQNILSFRKDYPDCRIFRLERNYRSTRTIVDAANTLIEKNTQRIPKVCRSEGEMGEPIAVRSAFSEQNEAVMVVSGILDRMRREHATYSDFAILYRTNAQSRPLEEALRARNLPYMIYSGNSFFERAEVKDLMAYFKLVVNPEDDESFKRVVNKPARGIGDTTLAALYNAAHSHGISLFKAAWAQDLELFGLKQAAIAKLRQFCSLIDTLAAMRQSTDADQLARLISDRSGIYALYKADNSVEGQSKAANVEELVNSVVAYVEEQKEEEEQGIVTLGDYLENVSLLSNVDVTDEEDASNRISLMTVHSAKGLEFPYVFIVGLEENLFPSGGMVSGAQDIEEERRLMYVAVTRAKKALALSYATSRMRNGKHESNPPSRFIRDIDPSYLELPADFHSSVPSFGGFGSSFLNSSPARTITSRSERPFDRSRTEPAHRPAAPQRPSFSTKPEIIDPEFVPVPMTELYKGERIEHNRFGGGLILEISGTAPELKARIRFDDYGEKLLLLKYAKLRPERK
ncbi:MAG: 3'-5' exonuclease [Candidatus Cryptobacteroides sp.]|nr:3'-5' exonuclease [Candidatus Cryptobacteroides sp.]